MEGSSGPASSAAILSFGYTIIITVCCLLLSVFQQSDQGNTTLIVVPSCLHLMTTDGLHVCRVSTLNWANVPVLFEERNCLINLQSGTCLVVWGCFPNSGAASYQSKTNSGCFYVDRHWLPCTPADPTFLFMCQHGTRSYLCKTNLYKSPIKFRNHAVCNFWGLDHVERYSTHWQLAALRNHPAIAPQLLSDISDLVISWEARSRSSACNSTIWRESNSNKLKLHYSGAPCLLTCNSLSM